jgi:3'(2'), 5'-bisphosphate nucleotidase
MNELEFKYQSAIVAAIKASEAIMEIYATDFSTHLKGDGSPVTLADLTSSDIISSYLEPTSIPITGEETLKKPYSDRKEWEECWCVDPLDGTKEFVRKNGEFVVSIGLIKKQQPHFGVIASPVSRRIIIGGEDVGAFIFSFDDFEHPEKWKKLAQISTINSPVVVISSRSHYSGNLLSIIQSIENTHGAVAPARMGSALKFFDLVQGKADVYPRLAPTMEWDIVAGHAIYKAVGGDVLNLDTNKPLTYNKESLFNPFFIASKKIMKLK